VLSYIIAGLGDGLEFGNCQPGTNV